MPQSVLTYFENRFFNRKATAYLAKHKLTHPTILWSHHEGGYGNPLLTLAGSLVGLFGTGWNYDKRQVHPNEQVGRDFDRWTMKVPMLAFKSDVGQLDSTVNRYIPQIVFREEVLWDFYCESLLRLRRQASRKIEFRYVLEK